MQQASLSAAGLTVYCIFDFTSGKLRGVGLSDDLA